MESNQDLMVCIVRKKVIEYFVAVTPDGREIAISGAKEDELIDGSEIIGIPMSEEIQEQYSDGSFARSYSINEYLKVGNN